MKKCSIHDKTKQLKVNPDYFTGKVVLKEISSIVKSKEQKIYHVTFKNGARTKIHNHSGGQILIVTKGRGSLQLYSKSGNNKSKFQIKKTDKTNLNEGDIVYIPAKNYILMALLIKKKYFHILLLMQNPQ